MPSCSKCHRDLASSALFCASCGTPVVADQGAKVDPLIGQTFKGMYFIQKEIGSGGMGQVYQAMHVTLDVPIALKVLRKALLADPAIVQRFHREARAASRLRHPNVINVTDFGQLEDGTLFMAMEFVAGKSLARVIAEESPLSEQRIVRIGAQILAALGEAHAAQILHRDLKPENVMVEARRDAKDAVKVLDFGIAKIQMPGDGQGSTLTQAGLVCGTPGYMSPEQWGAEPLDARSDLYSVGVILYQMITGRLPFESKTPMEMARRQITERPPSPSELRGEGAVSPDLEALVMRAISASPADRPASAETMREDLLACVLLPEPVEAAQATAAPKTVVLPRAGGARSRASPPASTPTPGASGTAKTLPQAPAAARSPPPDGTGRRTPPATGRGVSTPPPSRTPPAAPGNTRRPAGSTARPAPTVPRHEEDEPEEVEETPAPPPPSNRTKIVVGAVAVLVVVAAAGIYLAVSSRGAKPDRPVETATVEPSRKLDPLPPPVVAKPVVPDTSPKSDPTADPPPGTITAAEPDAPPKPLPTPPRPAATAASSGAARPDRKADAPGSPPAGMGLFQERSTLNSIPIPPAESGDGVLSIRAEPEGVVALDGKVYGEAPREFRLRAGAHKVRVTNPQFGVREKKVVVVAGKREAWTADFGK